MAMSLLQDLQLAFISTTIEPVAQSGFCHPELVSGSRNVLILLDAETSSA
jgi:hypothetical protein